MKLIYRVDVTPVNPLSGYWVTPWDWLQGPAGIQGPQVEQTTVQSCGLKASCERSQGRDQTPLLGAESTSLLNKIEIEKSLYSDHELKCLAEGELLRQRNKYDFAEKIVLVQDIEDMWEQKFQKFKPAPRITDADRNNDRTSLNRKLDQNLLLLVKQKFGDEDIWVLPQTEWQHGETLRDTVERVLVTLPGIQMQAKFLGNAPCGFYKFKFPKAIRTESNTGGKVFFFKAFLEASPQFSSKEKLDYLWVSKGELGDYLKPAYHSQVSRFLVDI